MEIKEVIGIMKLANKIAELLIIINESILKNRIKKIVANYNSTFSAPLLETKNFGYE